MRGGMVIAFVVVVVDVARELGAGIAEISPVQDARARTDVTCLFHGERAHVPTSGGKKESWGKKLMEILFSPATCSLC